jgi:protein SCO1
MQKGSTEMSGQREKVPVEKGSRRARTGLVAAVALLIGIAAAFALWRGMISTLDGSMTTDLGQGDYALTATDGTAFTEASLKGGPSAVFFGFTHCPEVCPTTLGDILTWQEELGADAAGLRIYFVTVDPERDTADMLADYVGWLPGALGVTGPRAEIDKAMAAFRIYAKKIPLEGEEYTMDHSAYVMLFDGQGQFFEPISYGEETVRAVDKLKRLLKAG